MIIEYNVSTTYRWSWSATAPRIERFAADRRTLPTTQRARSLFGTYLWCPRGIAAERITARSTGDTTDRLRAWSETAPIEGDLLIDTSQVRLVEAARRIDEQVRVGE